MDIMSESQQQNNRDNPVSGFDPEIDDLLEEAGALYDAGKLEESIAGCRRAIERRPGLVPAHVLLSRALRALGEYTAAVRSGREALALAPDDTDAHEVLGRALAQTGMAEEGLTILRCATEIAADRARTWVALGELELNMGRFKDAEATLRRAIEIEPENADAYMHLSWVLRRLGRADEASEAGRAAVACGPSPLAYNYLSFSLLANDEFQAALDSCDAGLELDPQNTSGLAYKVSALDGVGRRDDGRALADIERFLTSVNVDGARGFASIADFNAALTQHVLAFPTRPGDKTQTLDLMLKPAGPIPAFKELIDAVVTQYLSRLPDDPGHPYLAYKPKRWRIHAWGTRLRSTDVAEHHYHQHAWVSGVYYARVPAALNSARDGFPGWIEFCRFQQYSERPVESEFMVIRPEEGLMVLFPAYLYHRVVPFEGTDWRVSLAFNIIPNE